MSEQIVCMGSYGDLCIILPYAYDVFKRTNKPINIVVAQNYADLLEGVSYINPIIYPEKWQRGQPQETVMKAVEWVRQQCGDGVKWINPVESAGPRKQAGESFVHEMWQTLGRFNDWRNAQLTFDRRDSVRETYLAKKFLVDKLDRPIVLLALDGAASPFPNRDDLSGALRASLNGAAVLDISAVKGERPYDLLGLMDRAQLLVAADTFALHLSAASKVPVIALSRDLPTFWNGTPWHRRFELHCRYSQYPNRKEELLHTAKQIVSGMMRPAQRPITGLESGGYNPSLIRWKGSLWSTYRYHPHQSWKTHLALVELDESTATATRHIPITVPVDLRSHSVEDMRLWESQGRLMGAFVASTVVVRCVRCTMNYGEIVLTDHGADLMGVQTPQYGNNDVTALEKNWVFFDHQGQTHFIYACDPEHTVVTIRQHWKTPALPWSYGQIRGGTPPLPFRGKWLRFFHSQLPISDKPRDCRYYVGAYVMNNEPPFEMLEISSHPILSGHEWRSPAPHWKPNVVIPYGAVEQGEGWLVSVGVNDSAACLVKITEKHLNFSNSAHKPIGDNL